MCKVCVGEIIQMFCCGFMNIFYVDYCWVIDLKIVEFFCVLCFFGSWLVGYLLEFVEVVSCFGRYFGIVYQIYDDLVDFFGNEKCIGKIFGIDFVSGKIMFLFFDLMEWLLFVECGEFIDEIFKCCLF